MRKGFNTLSEQMGRMKSLFTEERLFGNLVEQEVSTGCIKGDCENGQGTYTCCCIFISWNIYWC